MGLITGICSKDQSNVAELLYKMAMKLRHRGNSPFCFFRKRQSGWDTAVCENPEEILQLNTSFGVVGRHLLLNRESETIPYMDCQDEKHLLIDGQIFNAFAMIQELKESHKGNLANPSIILHLWEEMQQRIFDFSQTFEKLYNLLEGMFAAALILKEQVFLFRDLIGLKPLYIYFDSKYVAFASEQKALWGAGFIHPAPLLPGRVVRMTEKGFTSHFQAQYNRKPIEIHPLEYFAERLVQVLKTNLVNLTPEPANAFGLLLSGGIDSTLLAALLKNIERACHSLVIGTPKSKDIQSAQQVAEFLSVPLEVLEFDDTTLEKLFPDLMYHIENLDEKKLNIAFPLFYGASHLRTKGVQIVCTGNGADEIFGGYERHELQFQEEPNKLTELLWEDIKNLSRGNLERDDAAAMAHAVELRLPYLTQQFIEMGMQIPPALKIHPPDRKFILRYVGKQLGLPESIFQKPKQAIQFSSGSYATLRKLARRCGFSKDFALKHGFFSPTQLFIDSLAALLGFPDIDEKTRKFVQQTAIPWPDSFLPYEKVVNKIS